MSFQPLVVEHELANRLRKLVTLPLAFASPRRLALALRRVSLCGLMAYAAALA
jgi:hypothetical protein